MTGGIKKAHNIQNIKKQTKLLALQKLIIVVKTPKNLIEIPSLSLVSIRRAKISNQSSMVDVAMSEG